MSNTPLPGERWLAKADTETRLVWILRGESQDTFLIQQCQSGLQHRVLGQHLVQQLFLRRDRFASGVEVTGIPITEIESAELARVRGKLVWSSKGRPYVVYEKMSVAVWTDSLLMAIFPAAGERWLLTNGEIKFIGYRSTGDLAAMGGRVISCHELLRRVDCAHVVAVRPGSCASAAQVVPEPTVAEQQAAPALVERDLSYLEWTRKETARPQNPADQAAHAMREAHLAEVAHLEERRLAYAAIQAFDINRSRAEEATRPSHRSGVGEYFDGVEGIGAVPPEAYDESSDFWRKK